MDLVWEESTLWPAAYSTFVRQLHRLIDLYSRLLEKRIEELPDADSVLDQSSRVLPTKFHYAAASLGAWAGGASNFQFFSYFAIQPQQKDKQINLAYAKRIGYDETTAKELDESGIVAIPASLAAPLLQAQGRSSTAVLGGIPVNEFNAVNLPDSNSLGDVPIEGKDARFGFLMDSFYRAPFTARTLGKNAVFGASNVLRDHYSAFYKQFSGAGLLRCKHYCVPIIEVGSFEELKQIVAEIPIHDQTHGLFFRGQNKMYSLARANSVRAFLFGDSCSSEPSLLTSAARNKFDYDSLHYALGYYLEQYVLFVESIQAEIHEQKYIRWRELKLSPLCEIDYAIMALGQHYGIQTHGLDVTTSLDVALWFAINKHSPKSECPATYRQMSSREWAAEPKNWPLIFVGQVVTHSLSMSLLDCLQLEEFGLRALRPHRQSAKFFHGGHSDHQNRLAEALVCAFRLRPGTYDTGVTFDELFPPPDEDNAYAALLGFASFPPFQSLGVTQVIRYHG